MTGAVANAVAIRQALRATSVRVVAARLNCSKSTVARVVQKIDPVAAVLDALGLEVRARA